MNYHVFDMREELFTATLPMFPSKYTVHSFIFFGFHLRPGLVCSVAALSCVREQQPLLVKLLSEQLRRGGTSSFQLQFPVLFFCSSETLKDPAIRGLNMLWN